MKLQMCIIRVIAAPGHDDYPSDTYRNRRSKKARAKGIKKEHRHARRVKKQMLNISVKEGCEQ